MKTAPDSDRILITGGSEIPQEWMRCADVFLSCSEFEGMPLAPIEALGSGIPAVLSQIPGHEFLGAYADLYSLESPRIGAQAVERVWDEMESNPVHYRAMLWERSRPIRESFTQAEMAKQYERLYEGRA
jgi:glycosyltransferase involved in cell wall biosynthesis